MGKLDYASALREALFDPNPRSSVDRTKSLVIRELLDVDPRINIKNTEYFNHSFSPDLVLSWPGNSGKANSRYVFLRLPDDPGHFVDDLALISDLHPIVFGLEGDDHLQDALVSAEQVSRESNTLITDVHGVERLAQNRQERSIANLISSALIRGGRGVVNSDGAESISNSVSSGFEGARTADAGSTRSAIETMSSHLSIAESRPMTQFLQAIWISSQGRIDGFPGPHEISGDVSDESLEYLIHFDPIADREFWRALGASVTVEQLSRLVISGAPENLQYLISENLDRLWSRQMLINAGGLNLEAVPPGANWQVARRTLALVGEQFVAHFAQSASEMKHIKNDKAFGMTFGELQARSASTFLTEITLEMRHETVTLRAQEPLNVLQAEGLSALGSYLDVARVVKATARTPGGQEVHCDFLKRDATAITSAKVSLEDWISSILPLMYSLESGLPVESLPLIDIQLREPLERDEE